MKLIQITVLAFVLSANICLVSAAVECGGTDAKTQTEWQLIYGGRVFSQGITTFSYRIETETDKDSPLCSFGNNCQDLSHWDLILPCSCPYTSTPVSSCGPDGSTTLNGNQFSGIKWEPERSSTEETLYYTLSYPGDVPEGTVTYIVKGSTRCGTSTITGPAIDANNCAEAPECDNAVDCADDICDAGVCVYQQNDANCDDGFACTADECTAAGCTNDPVDAECQDAFACTEEVCNPAANDADINGCIITAKNDLCDDQVDCTEDKCDQDTTSRVDGCVFTENNDNCEDNNVCTDDECSLTEDCVFPANTLPCDDFDECTGTTEDPDTCGNSSCQPGGAACPAFEAIVWAGQHFNSGEVVITNDGKKIYFVWTASTGWSSKEFHIYVGVTAPAKSNPGRFPFNFNLVRGVTSAEFAIPFPAGVSCGSRVYVAFHVVVNNNGAACLATGECPGASETGWMDGNDAPVGWHQWGNYDDLTVCCCTGFSHLPALLGNSAVSVSFTSTARKAAGSPSLSADEFAQYFADLLDYPVSHIYIFSFEAVDDHYDAVVGFSDYQGISGSTMVQVLEQTPPESFDQFGIGNVDITVPENALFLDEELQMYETSETQQSTANCLVFSLVLLVTLILF